MFYSHTLLSRKGPLGNIWVAAYCHKRLKKDQVAETDISSSVDKIMLHEVTVTYRVLGYFLLGVVRIYSKKVDYLYHDCNEILIKINNFSVAGRANLPREAICAPFLSITLPDKFELDAFDLEVVEDVSGGHMRSHEEIMLEAKAWEDEENEPYNLNRSHHMEVAANLDISSAYIPVEDVSPHRSDLDMVVDMVVNMVISPSHSLSSLEASVEKLQGNQFPQEECPDLDMICATEEPEDLGAQFDKVNDQDEKIEFLETPPLDVKEHHVFSEGLSVAITHDRTPDESKYPYSSDVTPLEIMGIPTPAKKEHVRMSRKRRHFFDDIIVLPNEVVRQCIHDSSSLVAKRRKVPNTALDAWKADKIFNLWQDFLEPLNTCICSELSTLFCEKNVKTPEKTPEPAEVAEGPNNYAEVGFETPGKFSKQRSLLQENSADHSTSMRSTEGPNTIESDKLVPKTSVESVEKVLSPIETQDLVLNLLNEEINPHDENNQDVDGWSFRTRTMARYLQKSFLNQKEQKKKGVLNLAEVLEGRSRKESARLFYEILVLKTKAFVDVKQETPYDDILVLTTTQIEAIS